MTLQIVLTIILPLIERITQLVKSIKQLAKVDSRILAFIVSAIITCLLKIGLLSMSGFLAGLALAIPAWIDYLVSGYILSLGSNAVHWVFNQVAINKAKPAE